MNGREPGRGAQIGDAALTLFVFAVLGVAGGFLWHHLVTLPTFTRTPEGGAMDQIQLAGMIGIDGWFFVVAGVGGLLAGIGLMLWRGTEPVLVVLLLLVGGALASYLMLKVGLHLGPGDPASALTAAKDGATVPVQLRPQAHGVEFAWPLGALVGGLLVLLFVSPRTPVETVSEPAG